MLHKQRMDVHGQVQGMKQKMEHGLVFPYELTPHRWQPKAT